MRTALITIAMLLAGAPALAQRTGGGGADTTYIAVRAVPADVGTFMLLQASGGTFLIGQQPLVLEWSAPDTGVPGWYETRVSSGNFVNVALATRWTMPTLTAGTYAASVRACVTDPVTQEPRCGPEATLSFTLVNPVVTPGAPNAPRIIPPNQVLSGQEIRQLADSFSYVHRLQMLQGQEWNWLSAQYTGPIPVTYESELTFLNQQLVTLLLLR